MIWQSASEFWAMGGYGVYVWGSMGMSAALMALEVWLARVGRSQALDAVCEAMDAQALDAEISSSTVATPVAASRTQYLSRGSAS
jgi:heme exporter protein D